MDYSVNSLIAKGEFICSCGKKHSAHLKKAEIYPGAVKSLVPNVKELGGTRAYIVADENTFAVAGGAVTEELNGAGIEYSIFCYGPERIEPDENTIGSAVLHFDEKADIIIAVGSGVINDTCKILAGLTNLPYIVVGTAPSMDGYASSTSSVIRDSLKVSVNSKCPDVVIGDIDILSKAPYSMLLAGLGDMLAKYVSICEWRIGNIVTGEYYCEEVAKIIRAALKKCVDSAQGLKNRNPEAVRSVMEGMVLSGIAADYAGVSRPVSGVEHYFSHVWDMRYIEFGTPMDFHGTQCGIGTYLASLGYEKLLTLEPDREKALAFAESFDDEKWFCQLEKHVGRASEAMIEAASFSTRYDRADHKIRVNNIIDNWDKIKEIIREEIPSSQSILSILQSIDAPVSPADIGIPVSETAITFRATRDIRDKYILSSLAWDLGVIDEIASIY